MSISAKSVVVFAIYLTGMGVGFVFVPNLVLGPLGLPPVTDVWSRVVGMMALLLAFYYIQAARTGLTAFFRWTVYTRVAAFFFFYGLRAGWFGKPGDDFARRGGSGERSVDGLGAAPVGEANNPFGRGYMKVARSGLF